MALIALAAPSDKVDCSKAAELLDELGGAQGMSTMYDKYKLATNEQEQLKRCEEMSDAIKTLRKYNKECYSSLTQQVFSAILRTRSQMNEAHCKPGSPEIKETYEASKCVQENSFDALKDTEKKVILLSQVIFDANIPDDKLRTRRACCAVISSKDAFMGAIKEKCAKHEKIYSDYVDSYTSEAMGLICPEADKLECNKLEAIKTDGVEPKTRSFLVPMLRLVKTLDH